MRDRTGAGVKSVKSTASCSARPLWHGRCDTVDATAGVRQFAALSAITVRAAEPGSESEHSVAPERLGKPPRPAVRRDRGVHQQRAPAAVPATQSATPSRSAGARTVTASNPYPRPTAARSISGKLTVAWSASGKWCTSAP